MSPIIRALLSLLRAYFEACASYDDITLNSTYQLKDGMLTPFRINEMAKVELSQRVGGKGVKIDYRYEKEPEMVRKEGKIFCEIGVYLTGWGFEGVRLGGGRGLNKVEAGNRAAMEALKSEVVEKAASIKRDFDAKVREEREKDTAAANGGEKKD